MRLAPDRVAGAAFDSGQPAAQVEFEGSPESQLAPALRSLADAVPTGDPVRLTIDLDDLFRDLVVTSDPRRPAGSVLLVQAAPRPPTHPALARHPDPLVARHTASMVAVTGGHSVTGAEFAPLDEHTVISHARSLAAGDFGDVRDVAVVATGSLASADHEQRIAEIFSARAEHARVSISSDFGGVGLTGRASTTVLNAALTRHTEEVISHCESATRSVLGNLQPGFARGDGGRSLAPLIRAYPAFALGSSTACLIAGAAYSHGLRESRVLVNTDRGTQVGEVRDAMPVVVPGQLLAGDTRLSLPTPRLSGVDRGLLPELLASADEPLVVMDDVAAGGLALPEQHLRADPDLATLLAIAHCQPSAFIDELAAVGSAEEVHRARADAEQRGLVMAMTAGGLPGTERVIESSVMGIPYGGAARVRIRVRCTSVLADD